MADQFFGFSPESFEQFARALSLSVFGPGVTAFGNGPDGGREATFRGEVPYPYPPTTCWSGYGVIQAKCKEKPESTKKDQTWVFKRLREELSTFVRSERRHPKPEYYVFITNVELSSTAGGAKDEAEDLIQSYYARLPLKGHAVWDANQLAVLLAQHQDIRKRFTVFLTPADVLAAMLADIERKQPNIKHILTSFLERELRADEAARLDQAGNRTDEQLRLAQLFFDLPASKVPKLLAPEEHLDPAGRLPSGVLSEILHSGSRKLDAKTLFEQETLSSEIEVEQLPTRYVLLGGPGSGKSTLVQFLAQIHRSALLMRRPQELLCPQTRNIIKETSNLCNSEDLPWPTTPRCPFRVDLNRFAKALASHDETKSLAGYLLSSLSSHYALSHEQFLEWLSTYPVLVVLDGLDEVPANSNRSDLVTAVNDFISELRQVGADLFVVATSREQGYAGEFSEGVVALRHILPLSSVRALQYVKKYADARFGQSNPDKARDIAAKLREIAARPLTAQLMGSPLQVTFMATVVAARGDPGENRWQLFEGYYRTIYDRERQKAVPPYDTVLSNQQVTIDRLHHDIGFWLQYCGEMTGGTAASVPIGAFAELVDAYLTELGREGPDKDELSKLITDAARQRLVFLTSRVAGELSFDVRSLQEYMAAECLMSGEPELVKARLRSIAPAPYWRNVLLFAVSRCFADTHSRHLQDAVRILCEDLNGPADQLLYATKAGSELAIDIMQSGAVAENPNHSRHLARIGLALISRPYLILNPQQGPSIDQRLALIYRDFLESEYNDKLQLLVGQLIFRRTLGAWPLLLRLASAGIQWASTLLEEHWPRDIDQFKVLYEAASDLARSPCLRRRFEEFLFALSPAEAFPISHSSPGTNLLSETCPLLNHHDCQCREVLIPVRSPGSHAEGCEFNLFSVHQPKQKVDELLDQTSHMPQAHPGWLPYILAKDFLLSPTPQTLAEILTRCADGGWKPSDTPWVSSLPWPLAACLSGAESSADLRTMATWLQQGDAGTTNEWSAAEERWSAEGLSLNDLGKNRKQLNDIDRHFEKHSIPEFGLGSFTYHSYPDSFIRDLFRAAQERPAGQGRRMLWWFLRDAALCSRGFADCVDPSELRTALENGDCTGWWENDIVVLPENSTRISAWLDFFEWLGRSDILSPSYPVERRARLGNDNDWCETFQRAFLTGTSRCPESLAFVRRDVSTRLGLLRLLGRLASRGRKMNLIPCEMLNLPAGSDPRFKLAALLVRIAKPKCVLDDAESLANEVISLLEPPAEKGAADLLFRAIESHLSDNGRLITFLLHLHETLPTEMVLEVAKCESLLRGVLRSRASALQSREELRKLKLPVVEEG